MTRKLLGTVVVLLTMAILLPGAARPQAVGACGWYLEQATFANTWVWDSRVNGWTTIDYKLETYNNGCGSRYYVSRVWTGDGTPTWLVANIRVWVCGAYQTPRSSGTIWGNAAVSVSGPFFYGPWCGRQADNAGSASGVYFISPATSDYLTAG